jgi:uncharacterized protein
MFRFRSPLASETCCNLPRSSVISMLFLDADGCPVKDEAYRVAERYGLHTYVVANSWLRVPETATIERVTVGDRLDEADDWIAARAGPGDIVVTSDIPLADRAIKAGAKVVTPDGRVLDARTIGDVLATRNLLTDLREAGTIRGGGRPFGKAERSRFLEAMDRVVTAIRRGR